MSIFRFEVNWGLSPSLTDFIRWEAAASLTGTKLNSKIPMGKLPETLPGPLAPGHPRRLPNV